MSSSDAEAVTGVRCSPGTSTCAADDPLAQLAAVLDEMGARHPSDLPPEALGRQLLDLEAALAALRAHERTAAQHLRVLPVVRDFPPELGKP
ncbi:MAG: hypothetical protein GEV11_28725 [Streptosporangiales bacterium]|nr:hypothetical protein [Streptosporangiales bacterium]